MGWNGGSDIMRAVIEVVKKEVPNAGKRMRIYRKILSAMEDEDWDTQGECEGLDIVFDEILEEEQG